MTLDCSSNKFFKSHFFNLLAFFVLSIYFIMLILSNAVPYLRATFLSGQIFKIVISFLFLSFLIICVVFLRKKGILSYLILSILIFITNALVVIISGRLKITLIDGNLLSISFFESLLSICQISFILFLVYSYIWVFPNLLNKRFFLILLLTLFSGVALTSAFYCDIFQFNDIIHSFTAKGEDAHFYQITSFFDNKNYYGFILFMGITSLLLTIYILKGVKSKLLWIPVSFLFLNLIISRSKTPLFLIFFILVCIFFRFIIKSYAEHRVFCLMCAGSIFLILLISILFLAIPKWYNSNSISETIYHFFVNNIFLDGVKTFSERLLIISEIKTTFFGPMIIPGYGELIWSKYVSAAGFNYVDSYYLVSILSGGLLLFIMNVYVYWIAIKKIFIMRERNQDVGFLCITILISIIVYGFFENIGLVSSSIYSFVFAVYIFSIPSIYEESLSLEQRKI